MPSETEGRPSDGILPPNQIYRTSIMSYSRTPPGA
nr:MAG TPA: hypothetical protein [Caudoviricetes sp.]